MNSMFKIYEILLAVWNSRRLIIIFSFLIFIGFICTYFIIPKSYIFNSAILIKDYNNPIISNPREKNEWTEQRVNTFLHSRHILDRIAFTSKFINQDMPHLKREALLAYLHNHLTATVKDGTLITIQFIKQGSNENMDHVLQAASTIFLNYHNAVFTDKGVDFSQAKRIMGSIDNSIAAKTAELARLSTRYSNQHSTIQSISKEIKKLIEERDNINTSGMKSKTKQINGNEDNNTNTNIVNEEYRITKYIKLGVFPIMPLSSEFIVVLFYLVVSLIVGVGISVGFVILNEMLRSTIRRRDILEDITGIPVLSRIPLFSKN